MKISLCLITKNEEKNLPVCLDSVKSVVDEIIIVDHYSEDKTAEIARTYGAKVYLRKWTNDFAAARNYAIEHATGKWIIFLDADEHFSKSTTPILRKLIQEADRKQTDLIMSRMVNVEVETNTPVSSVDHIRIFRNDPSIRYSGMIHEAITQAYRPLRALNAVDSTLVIHTGYSKRDIENRHKSQRNLDILLKQQEQDPLSSDIAFYIGECYLIEGNYDKVIEYAKKAIELENFRYLGIKEKNYVNLIGSMMELALPDKEIMNVINQAMNSNPSFPDFHFRKADLLRRKNRSFDALEEYQHGIETLQQGLGLQSSTIQTMDRVLFVMGQLHETVGQLHDSVSNYVESLKFNPHQFLSLANLMKLLSKSEELNSIIDFFRKLYPETNSKNLAYLFKAALETYRSDLVRHFSEQIDTDQRGALPYEFAMVHLIVGDYAEAYFRFRALYKAERKTDHAIHAAVAAYLSNESSLLDDLCEMAEPSVARIAEQLLGSEKSQLSETDSNDFLKFWVVLVKLRKLELAYQFLPGLHEFNILPAAADFALTHGENGLAANLLHAYLESMQNPETKMLSSVLYKMAVCARNLNQWETTRELCKKSQDLAPEQFEPYELLVQVCNKFGVNDSERKIIETGCRKFPESNYLKLCFR